MVLLDVRRLPGSNLLWNKACSVLDVECTPSESKLLIPMWEGYIRKMLHWIGWNRESTTHLPLSGGISLAFSAPIDGLYTASAINEWAWACCEAELGREPVPDFEAHGDEFRDMVEKEKNPALHKLEKAANKRGVSFLWDDDEVTLGLGTGSETWSVVDLPNPDSLDWNRYHDVPIGIVTGTNGKTTTVRLIHHILCESGQNTGISSTDWIGVNHSVIDRGDWSGPGGARQVLRQQNVDVAILETARGGLLRRGLGVARATAALITNLSEDHLGDFGSRSLEELLNIKWLVSRTVESQGILVLNGDDPMLVEKALDFPGSIVWFTLQQDNQLVIQHVRDGGIGYIFDGRKLVRAMGNTREIICDVNEIPLTMNGAATHNISNALAAAALAEQLGASIEQVRSGLVSMSQHDNPGRSNVYSLNGITVLVDFAHNPAAMKAILQMAQELPAKRRLLAFAQAGDRPDKLIREQTRYAWASGLEAVIVSELAAYHRGRCYGEIFEVIKGELLQSGAKENQILHFDEELDSLQAALDWANTGDMVIMLALGDRLSIQQKLQSFAQQ